MELVASRRRRQDKIREGIRGLGLDFSSSPLIRCDKGLLYGLTTSPTVQLDEIGTSMSLWRAFALPRPWISATQELHMKAGVCLRNLHTVSLRYQETPPHTSTLWSGQPLAAAVLTGFQCVRTCYNPHESDCDASRGSFTTLSTFSPRSGGRAGLSINGTVLDHVHGGLESDGIS